MAIAPLHSDSARRTTTPARSLASPPTTQSDLSRRTASVLLLAVTALAAVLRLWNPAAQSLRLDEGFTIRYAALPLRPVMQGHTVYVPSLFQNVASDVHPPGYFLLMHFWMRLFGADLAVLRLPSEIAGILVVPAVYLLAKSLYSRRTAVIAALLGACSPFWIWHSQEARMYSFLVLLTVLSTYGLVLAIEHRRAIGWPIFAVASILALYTQYFAVLTLAAQGIWVLIQWLRPARPELRLSWAQIGTYALILIVVAASFVPWLFELRAHYHGASDPSLTSPNLYTPLVMLTDFLFGYLSVPSTSLVVAAWPLLVPLALAVGTWGRHMSSRGLLLWLLFLFPIVAGFGVTLTVRPVLSVRYLAIVMPAMYILIGVVLSEALWSRTPRSQKGRRVTRLLVPAAIVGVSLLAWHIEEVSAANPQTEDYHTPVSYIEHHIRPGDVVALDAYFNQDAFSYYSHLNVPVYALPTAPGLNTSVNFPTYLHQIETGRKRLWVLYYLETNGDARNGVHHYLDYNTAGHTVIDGGPFGRDDAHFPDSYRNVQLVLYRLIPQAAGVTQVRPETIEELRALTHISPTVRRPFASPYGSPGETLSMVGALGAIPIPRPSWYLPAVHPGSDTETLTVFNPNKWQVHVSVTGPGSTHSLGIPANSEIDVALSVWAPEMVGAPLTFHAPSPIVAHLTLSSRRTERYIYAGHMAPRQAAALDTKETP